MLFSLLDRCKLPIFLGGTQGRCQSPVENWFHDKGKGECVKHLYFGCAGNSNRFSTKEECLDLCVQEGKEKINIHAMLLWNIRYFGAYA